MRFYALLCSIAFLFCTAASAYAYEFHLLNGMVIKGELKDFKDGKFNIATDFGFVIIEPSKLDYIVVNQGDGHPQTDGAPGFSVKGAGVEGKSGPEPVPQGEMESPVLQPVLTEPPGATPPAEPPVLPEPPKTVPEQELTGSPSVNEPPLTPEPPAPLEGLSLTAPPSQ